MIEWPFPHIKPREVQLEALQAGFGKQGFAYFLRMRLGKTFLTIAEYTILREQGLTDWIFIICPNSLKDQWQEAIEACDPYLPIHIYDSQTKSKSDYYFSHNKRGGAFIINYESLKSFIDNGGYAKFDPLRTYCIADESTKIKEPSKKMSKAALELAAMCNYTRVLTGKPKANSNSDLWSQLKFINATQRNFHQHKYYFTIMGGFKGRSSVKDVNTELLKEEMAPYCYIAPDKYLKGFEKIYEPLRRIHLKGEQKELYDKMENELVFEINNTKCTAPIVLVKYLRLQQISSGVVGDIDGQQHNLIEPKDNPKVQEVIEILETEIDKKVIIVCRFKLSIDNLYKVLTNMNYKVAVMKGGMGPRLEQEKYKFNDPNDNYDILLAQTQVLSFGHTLCGPDDFPCDSMIFYENDFSLINRAQCESRPEKMDRDLPISYYDLFASKMDKYIVTSLIKKEDASLSLMGYARERGILFGATQSDNSSGIQV